MQITNWEEWSSFNPFALLSYLQTLSEKGNEAHVYEHVIHIKNYNLKFSFKLTILIAISIAIQYLVGEFIDYITVACVSTLLK